MVDLSGQSIGRYHLIEQLGEGGMAIVYKAYDTRLEREVAVKIIRKGTFPPEMLDEVLKRFEREAKSLARLSHPNIVKVHDFGEYENSPYLVLEYMPGGTLKKLLGKPIPWQEALKLILPIARGVEYAHRHNIVHRDIKPSNILITESGEPMLSDFGIAKILERDQATALTSSGMAVGTPEYMAPEQWTGVTSAKSDLYSLGIVLYEMMTGRKPYIADTPAAVLIKQATEPLPRPSQFEPDLPESVEWLLIKSLAKEPEDRYANMSEFVQAIESLLGLPAGSSSSTARMETAKPAPERPSYPSQPATGKDISQPARTASEISRPASIAREASQPVKKVVPPAPRQRRWVMPAIIAGGVVMICVIIGCLGMVVFPALTKNTATATVVAVKKSPTAVAKKATVAAPTATQKAPPTQEPVVAAPAPTSTEQTSQFFTEYFKDSRHTWETFFLGTGDSNNATVEVRDGKLTFEIRASNVYAYYFLKSNSYTRVRLRLQAANRGINANNISLVCHKSNNGWYEFSVSNGGYWYLYYQNNGDYSIIAEGGSTAVKTGKAVNVYEMICDGNSIDLGVNGATLKSLTEKEYALKKGEVGLNVSSLKNVPVITEVDWLEIKAP